MENSKTVFYLEQKPKGCCDWDYIKYRIELHTDGRFDVVVTLQGERNNSDGYQPRPDCAYYGGTWSQTGDEIVLTDDLSNPGKE